MDSNVGKWNAYYAGLSSSTPMPYGDPTTYLMAAAFLADVDDVEDWGCGGGGFRAYCVSPRYTGLDGSCTPFADQIADLATYRSAASGIMMRHILEHNYGWQKILQSALCSFTRKMCLILFTPFADATTEIDHNAQWGIDVPDLSLPRAEIESRLAGLNWRLVKDLRTRTQYGVEHVYFIWR